MPKSCPECVYKSTGWSHWPCNGCLIKGTRENPTPDFIPIEKPPPGGIVQPMPAGRGLEIAALLMVDIDARAKLGLKKYGEPLKANNGRDALLDAYQEALDLCMYLRQVIAERPVCRSGEARGM